MNLLAFNTAGLETQIALIKGAEVFLKQSAFSRHSENLFPLLEDLMSVSNTSINEIDAFACVVGPGSFTGIRIGLSVVKGFAFALNKPVIEINSLELLGFNLVNLDSTKPICSVINAGAGLVYHQMFERKKVNGANVLKIISAPRVDKFKHFLGYLHSNYNDDVDIIYYNNNEKSDNFVDMLGESREYSVEALASIAKYKFEAQEFTDSKNVLPLYLRVSQAEAAIKNLEIRRASLDDIADIVLLESQNDEWDLNWTETGVRQSFDNPNYRCYLAYSGGEVKGMISVMLLAGEAEILRVVVLNSSRLNGVGVQMIEYVKETMRESKEKAIFLEVNNQNYPALSLYQKCGFREVGRRPDYYGEHQDAVLMRCDL